MSIVGALAVCACLTAALAGPVTSAPARPSNSARETAATAAAPRRALGKGSSYVGPAMGVWTSEAQTRGIPVEYTPSSSPEGLGQFSGQTIDFAGTEAEFRSLGVGADEQVPRGFQYVPDVAGAVAIMYHVYDQAGQKVNYLRLSRETVARIFIGEISKWSDPAITADNGGQLVLPNEDIKVGFRSGPSGTTALFYDFVAHAAPGPFRDWANRLGHDPDRRILTPNTGTGTPFAPTAYGFSGSDLMAAFVADTPWSITYDEFAYAVRYQTEVAWIQNGSGNWVQPYAGNISSALEDARLRPDLSQELSGVYASQRADAYPISAYSYIVTQCAPDPGRATCKGNYEDPGIAETMSAFMRYVACEGQVKMADIGYSPLPPNLSQEMANSIARMNGTAPETLTRENCANPRFDPNFAFPRAPDPPPLGNPNAPGGQGGNDRGGNRSATTTTECPPATTTSSTTPSASTTTTSTSSTTTSSTTSSTTTTTAPPDPCAASTGETADAGAGRAGAIDAVGGGSGDWRDGDPVAFDRPGVPPIGRWPLLVVVIVLAAPVFLGTVWRRLQGT
jgi:phosphate transport system substrate-binding protein